MSEQKATNITAHAHSVSKEERSKLMGHKGCVLWFTGLSACGKSTVANAVDRKLHDAGVHTTVLDGDNIRFGLNKNLGFSAEDRAENIRRIGEVAKLFADAGVVAATAFISPYRADRDKVRALMGSGGSLKSTSTLRSKPAKLAIQRVCTRRPAPEKSKASPASTIRTKHQRKLS